MTRTRFADWLDACGMTVSRFAVETGIDRLPVYYLAGIKPARPVKSVSVRILRIVSEQTGISPGTLMTEAIEASLNPREPTYEPGAYRRGRPRKKEVAE